MNRFETLAGTLHAILLSSLSLLPACDDGTVTSRGTVARSDESIAAPFQKCEAGDQEACTLLCYRVHFTENPQPVDHIERCEVSFDEEGAHVEVEVAIRRPGDTLPTEGRRPHNLIENRAPLQALRSGAATEIGAWLAVMAELEAASVAAFEQLADELEFYAAPPDLVAAARAAARDEVRHARVMTALSKRYGVVPSPVHVTPVAGPRPLCDIAVENAVEGCVRECYGALVAMHQAACAADRRVRAAMKAIADDEVRHAELALAVDAWARKREPELAANVDRARAGAVADLLREVTQPGAPRDTRIALGFPEPATAAQLLAQARLRVWRC